MDNKNNRKLYNLITVIAFVGLIFFFTAAHLFTEDISSSMEEQSLQTFPKFSWDSFIEGDFAEKLGKYFDDQFPLRSMFINLKAATEKMMAKGENNGILLADNGQQANKNFSVVYGDDSDIDVKESDVFDKERLNSNVKAQLEKIKSTTASAKERGITLLTVIPPRTIDIAASSFDYYPTEIWSSFNETVKSYDDGTSIIYPLDDYKNRYESGEYVYYRTDHHWTSLGAYYCYLDIMKAFGMEDQALAKEEFDIEKASEDFYGAFYRSSGYRQSEPDYIEFYKHDNDDFIISVHEKNEVKTIKGLFDYEKLKSNDQYTSFISGKNQYVTIEKKGSSNREKLIILKDSFGQSLAPFLAQHFDLEIYDFSISQYKMINKAIDSDCSKILIVCNAQNLIEQNYLKKVK